MDRAFPMSDIAACTLLCVGSTEMLKLHFGPFSSCPLNVTELFERDPVLSSLQIVGDAVGWGFVVRGSNPCHIQAVDPSGPAAAAGMKVGSQNGMISQGNFCCSVKVSGCLHLGRERCFFFQCAFVSVSGICAQGVLLSLNPLLFLFFCP